MGDRHFEVEHNLPVYHAQGIVTVQANCTFAEAFILMADRAEAEGRTLDEIAEAVIERRIRFVGTAT